MKNKKILITGSAGFIGYHLCKSLLKDNVEILGLDNLNEYYDVKLKLSRLDKLRKYENFLFEKIDIADRETLTKVFNNFKPDIVVNLAAQAGVRYSIINPYAYMECNLVGFLNIIELCRNNNFEGLIYASSSSVIDLMSPYAMTKAMCETMAPSNAIGMRFFTVYGPSSRPDMLYRMAMEDKLTYITQHQRDFTHINTLLPLIKAVIQKGKEGHVYGMGEGNPETVEQFLKRINYTKDVPFKEVTGESEYTCSKPFTI